jgi:hypothetical protein
VCRREAGRRSRTRRRSPAARPSSALRGVFAAACSQPELSGLVGRVDVGATRTDDVQAWRAEDSAPSLSLAEASVMRPSDSTREPRPRQQSDPGGSLVIARVGESRRRASARARFRLGGPQSRRGRTGALTMLWRRAGEISVAPRARQFVGLRGVVVCDQMRSNASWSSGSSQHAAMRFWRIS